MNSYTSNRVFKLNVGFLLSAGSGNNHETVFDVPAVRVSDDVYLKYVRGPLRLSRTKEGILVQGRLQVGLEDECYRCLDTLQREIIIDLEELYTYPASENAEFSIPEDAILDLSPLLRAEVLIEVERGALCKPDCKGLCPICGANLNNEACHCDAEDIDPRLTALKSLLDANS
jgi:uncharacterized protein